MNIEHGQCHGPQRPPTRFREGGESVLFEEGAPRISATSSWLSFNSHNALMAEAIIPVFQMWKLRLAGLHLLPLSHPVGAVR